MPIELRITSGARAGQSDYFEKAVISIGRHPASDFLLDIKKDLDVSRRHGEIRFTGTSYRLYDKDSTNGTFLNDEQLDPGGNRDIEDGDTIRFGAQGPTVSVIITGVAPRTTPLGTAVVTPPHASEAIESAEPADSKPHVSSLAAKLQGRLNSVERREAVVSAPSEPEGFAPARVDQQLANVADTVDATAEPSVEPELADRQPTVERVAIEVKKQTRVLRAAIVAAVAILGGVAGGMYWYGHRATASRDAEIQKLLAANEDATRQFQTKLATMNDTTVANALQRRLDSLIANAHDARDDKSQAAVQEQLRDNHDLQQRINAMDVPAVRNANDPAVGLIVADVGGKQREATGFMVTSTGLLVTNRHVVSDSGNAAAAKILVKFANTKEWKGAHLVKLDDNPNVDLALLQMDDAGQYQAVSGIATTMDAQIGAPIATIGFPLGTDSPMEGPANDFTAKTSLTIGRVSKSVPELLQIDAFAAHGSSGSPVVDEHGHVVGVVWGGPRGTGGHVVYAVPADKIAALVSTVK